MDPNKPDDLRGPLSDEAPQSSGQQPPSRRKRILALIGAIAMIALTLIYAYATATGKIFWI